MYHSPAAPCVAEAETTALITPYSASKRAGWNTPIAAIPPKLVAQRWCVIKRCSPTRVAAARLHSAESRCHTGVEERQESPYTAGLPPPHFHGP